MPDYTIAPDTDYEHALNKVAEKYGGGTEVWRLNAPGMPLKHFYPRQPKSPLDGPVTAAKLVVTQDSTTRIVEAGIPLVRNPRVQSAQKCRRADQVFLPCQRQCRRRLHGAFPWTQRGQTRRFLPCGLGRTLGKSGGIRLGKRTTLQRARGESEITMKTYMDRRGMQTHMKLDLVCH